MHLRSITLKGFKSFPQRTKLEFSPGVSVVVGPNGSGKSNVTDAVLWALGEQSPLAVRGQTMKDVIFVGRGGAGTGVASSRAAEVEVVIDNADHRLDSDFTELSIVRRIDLSGEGEYRLNGARCRLVDVLEVLSDTGLGREMHSVVSQGRVETIVHSRPEERRLLIEEAAGLGKHRKRRRRAQLKLERTEENLSRALDVEREARTRLRPLKRQAEAAELHERIERQSLEARLELAEEEARATRLRLGEAEAVAATATAERDRTDRRLEAVAKRRGEAEEALAARSRAREALHARLLGARSAAERIALRLERVREEGRSTADGMKRRSRRLESLAQEGPEEQRARAGAGRIAALEAELSALEEDAERRLRAELATFESELDEARRASAALEGRVAERRRGLELAERAVADARAARREAERELETARARATQADAELTVTDQALRAAEAGAGGDRPLTARLGVASGYELALAAALGARLRATVVTGVRAGEDALDAAGPDGASALIARPQTSPAAGDKQGLPAPPTPGAERLLDHVRPEPGVGALVDRLLGDAWVVDALDGLPGDFGGIAVTRAGRGLFADRGELVQVPAAGEQRVLEQRNRRQELARLREEIAGADAEARGAAEQAAERVEAAEAGREEAETELRRTQREVDQRADQAARVEWLVERCRASADDGPGAVRRTQIAADLRAERLAAEQAQRALREREQEIRLLRARATRDGAIVAAAERVATALEAALAAVEERAASLSAEVEADGAAGELAAGALRECAHEEARLQALLRRASESVTHSEVAAAQARDAASEALEQLEAIARSLQVVPRPSPEPLAEERRRELQGQVERLVRRRERLGPVNPLAGAEYEEAVAHVEGLEARRADLESALAELAGLIRETDRHIRESFEQTFEAAAGNFEEVIGHLFPGGRGRLRLTRAEGPRAVLGGQRVDDAASEDDGPPPEAGDAEPEPSSDPGVEVEVTPAGKSTKRLSLLSGGEKSLVALAFMFAVFLARPCPFYILDEVEAALDDVNIDRFLELVRRYADRAQFIVVTHQKRTMDAADCLYGVSMGADGVSRVISRRLGGGSASPGAGEPDSAAA